MFGIVNDMFNTGYKIMQDWRNFGYEKKLQQQIFDREDSAYQRAVADAQKAGLSKGVVGAGAGSGSVLGASSTDIGNTNFFENYQQRKLNALSLKQQAQDYTMSEIQKQILQEQKDQIVMDSFNKLFELQSNPLVKDYDPRTGLMVYDTSALREIKKLRFDSEKAKLKADITGDNWRQANQLFSQFMSLLGLGINAVK